MRLISIILIDKMVSVKRKGIFYLLNLQDAVSFKLFVKGSFEKNDSNYVFNLLNDGDIAIDVGANVGYYSLNFCKKVGGNGMVYAFEANKLNYNILNISSLKNGFKNINIYNSIISDTNENFKENTLNYDSSLNYYTKDLESTNNTSKLLDDYFETISKHNKSVKVLKIDVEGAEYLILKSAKKLLNSKYAPEYILIELYDEYLKRFDSSIEDIILFFKNYDYEGPYHLVNNQLAKINIRTGLESSDGNYYFLKVS